MLTVGRKGGSQVKPVIEVHQPLRAKEERGPGHQDVFARCVVIHASLVISHSKPH